MRKTLKSIAMQLSESDIQELFRLKKMEDKRVVALRKKRAKLAADIARLDSQIAKLGGETEAEAAPARRGRKPGSKNKKPGRKPGSGKAAAEKPAAKKTAGKKAAKKAAKKAVAKKPAVRKGKKRTRINLSATVRDIFAKAGAPLKASQVVDALPDAGIKVADVAAMRKRISVVLASQKSHFEQVERGVYQLKAQ